MKKSKSCEQMIRHNDLHESNELIETTSLQFDNSIDERWHNRFSLANRQKLISRQQEIDHKVKLTRLEQANKRRHQLSNRFLAKLKRPTTISKSFDNTQNQSESISPSSNHQQQIFNVPRVSITESYAQMHPDHDEEDRPSINFISDKRTHHYQQQSKMYNIDEDTPLADDNTTSHTNNEGGKEMILTATKLISHLMPSPSATNDKTSSSSSLPANVSLC